MQGGSEPLAWEGGRGASGAAGLGLWTRGLGGHSYLRQQQDSLLQPPRQGLVHLTPLPLLQQLATELADLVLELQSGLLQLPGTAGAEGQRGQAQRPRITQPRDGATRVPSPPPASEQLLGAFQETQDFSNGAQGDPRTCHAQRGRSPAVGSEAPLKEPGQHGALPTGPQGPFHPRIMQSSSGADLGALSCPQPQIGVGGPRPEAQHAPQNAPRPSQPAGPSSALACSHTDFQSPVPSHLHQGCPHTDTPVLCEGTATRRAPGRHATTGQGGTSPRGIGRGGSTRRTPSSRHSSTENRFPKYL